MSCFKVTKSSPVLVGPSEPTPAGNLLLTSTDKSRLCVSFTSLHVFDRPIHQPAETIRRALSHALVHYHPVAGRLAAFDSGDVQVACTGEGVAFISAAADFTLEDVKFLHAPLVMPLADLAARYGGRCGVSDPLLMAQVTEFTCGGFVVGVTWNHGIADAFGVAQLLCAVGELARGMSAPSIVPVRYDFSLPQIPQQLVSALLPFFPGFKHVDFVHTDVTIPWSFIRGVKAEFRRHNAAHMSTCSTFEVVAAAIWQCRTRAIDADPVSLVPLVFTANVRKHVGAKEGYYGNCITSVLVTATRGAVAGGDVVDVVRMIRHGKERIPDNLIRPVDEQQALGKELLGALCGYGALAVSSWGGIGLDAVDFGGGKPARVVPIMERTLLPCCLPCMPCSMKDADGVNVIAFCVTEEHLSRCSMQSWPSSGEPTSQH